MQNAFSSYFAVLYETPLYRLPIHIFQRSHVPLPQNFFTSCTPPMQTAGSNKNRRNPAHMDWEMYLPAIELIPCTTMKWVI